MTDKGSDAGLGDLLICPECSRSNPEGTRYCMNCGARLTGEAATTDKPREEKKRGFFAKLFGREDDTG